jgi:hypothetical protein
MTQFVKDNIFEALFRLVDKILIQHDFAGRFFTPAPGRFAFSYEPA